MWVSECLSVFNSSKSTNVHVKIQWSTLGTTENRHFPKLSEIETCRAVEYMHRHKLRLMGKNVSYVCSKPPSSKKRLNVYFLNEPLHLYSISLLVRKAKFLNPVISPYGNGPISLWNQIDLI